MTSRAKPKPKSRCAYDDPNWRYVATCSCCRCDMRRRMDRQMAGLQA